MAQIPLATSLPLHPRFSRRFALQVGAVSLVGLGANHLEALRAAPAGDSGRKPAGLGRARSFV
jgi:hypothetical protein